MEFEQETLEKIIQLRHVLHQCPEPSEQEMKTREILKQFLQEQTSLTVVDKGKWFYAIHKEKNAKKTIAFRADFDAIVGENGRVYHGCGHDGHAAILAGAAMTLEGQPTGNNILFLFQHAEENGAGAKECLEVFREQQVDCIYGIHNMPGFAKNCVVTRKGPLQCASKGMVLTFMGKQSHASEPEKGNNPAYAIGKLLEKLKPLHEYHGFSSVEWEGEKFRNLVLVTVVSVQVGSAGAFGVSPGRGQLELTIRSVYEEDLQLLQDKLLSMAKDLSKEEHLELEISYSDEFPDTINDPKVVEEMLHLFSQHDIDYELLKEPIRASEDFGHYLKEVPGAYMFLGSGTQVPLHSTEFEFCDEIIPRWVEIFHLLARS